MVNAQNPLPLDNLRLTKSRQDLADSLGRLIDRLERQTQGKSRFMPGYLLRAIELYHNLFYPQPKMTKTDINITKYDGIEIVRATSDAAWERATESLNDSNENKVLEEAKDSD